MTYSANDDSIVNSTALYRVRSYIRKCVIRQYTVLSFALRDCLGCSNVIRIAKLPFNQHLFIMFHYLNSIYCEPIHRKSFRENPIFFDATKLPYMSLNIILPIFHFINYRRRRKKRIGWRKDNNLLLRRISFKKRTNPNCHLKWSFCVCVCHNM